MTAACVNAVSGPATSGEVAYVGVPETTRGPSPEGLLSDR